MKKTIGKIAEEDILLEAKERAAREGRPLSELFQDALSAYLQGEVKVTRGDVLGRCLRSPSWCNAGAII